MPDCGHCRLTKRVILVRIQAAINKAIELKPGDISATRVRGVQKSNARINGDRRRPGTGRKGTSRAQDTNGVRAPLLWSTW